MKKPFCHHSPNKDLQVGYDQEKAQSERNSHSTNRDEGARWRSSKASDSESRCPGFDPHRRHCVVSLSKTH